MIAVPDNVEDVFLISVGIAHIFAGVGGLDSRNLDNINRIP